MTGIDERATERLVLGAVLVHPRVIADVGALRGEHFADALHRKVWEAVRGLDDEGKPIDVVSVSKRGQVDEAELVQLMGEVVTVENIGYHARQLRVFERRRAHLVTLRKLAVMAGDRSIAHEDFLDVAERELHALATREETEGGPEKMKPVLGRVRDVIERRSDRKGIAGISTGSPQLDDLTSGFQPGDLIVIGARPSMGKALSVDAQVLTPTGWRRNGDLRVGDEVIGGDGRPCLVTGVFDQGELDLYRVTFSDGASVECCNDHLWQTTTRAERLAGSTGSARPLSEIRSALRLRDGRVNHAIPYVSQVHFADRVGDLPLDPWLLGVWLGDGWCDTSVKICNPEEDILERVRKALPHAVLTTSDRLTWRVTKDSGMKRALEGLGLSGCRSWEKFVPSAYLLASVEDRAQILRGLFDTDGYVSDPSGSCVEYTTTSPQLRDDVVHLARSLGGRASWSARRGGYLKDGVRREVREMYRLVVSFPSSGIVPVSSQKHLAKYRGRVRSQQRSIVDVTPSRRALARCISVDSPGNLYVTNDFVVTHNTARALRIVSHCAKSNVASLIFSLEMRAEALVERLLSSETSIAKNVMRMGRLSQADWGTFNRGVSRLADWPIWIDDRGGLDVYEIRSTARRWAMQRKTKCRACAALENAECNHALVVVDHMSLIQPPKGGGGNREREVAIASATLKQLAKELNVPVVLLCQLNRSLEARADKRPMMSDLRECIAEGEDIYDAQTGHWEPIERVARGERTVVTVGVDEALRAREAPVARAWSTGTKAVFRVRTRTGRELRATGNHPLRTVDGWKRVDELSAGMRVAAPRVIPPPIAPTNLLTVDECRLLGYLISDGSYLAHRSVSYTKADPEMLDEVERIAVRRFGLVPKREQRGLATDMDLTTGRMSGPGGNALINWMKGLEIHGQRGPSKTVPSALWGSDNVRVAHFLSTLWAGDGSIVPRKGGGWLLKFTSTSRRLLVEVQRLLLRFGVVSVLGRPGWNQRSTVPIATLSVTESEAIVAFGRALALPGQKGEMLKRAVEDAGATRQNLSVDRLPVSVTREVDRRRRAAGLSHAALGYRCQGKEISPADLRRVAEVLGAPDLSALAEVLWDEVVSIEPDGEAETFDASVPLVGNFLVGGVFAHNSGAIEQDADLVAFIYRPVVYDPKADPTASELIIGKQRDGMTTTLHEKWIASTQNFFDE